LFFIGLGITAYGFSYFMIHDVLIHQRFKWFRTQKTSTLLVYESPQSTHKHLGKEHGMFLVCCLYLLTIKYNSFIWATSLKKHFLFFNEVGLHLLLWSRFKNDTIKSLAAIPHAQQLSETTI
jgi:hypothetical protein